MFRLLTSVVVLALIFSTSSLAAAPKPNVLLICVDDLKPLIGCYGDKIAITPNLDRLAKMGMTFDRAYCNQAVCAPSRNALLTGYRPQTLGIYDLSTNFRKVMPDAVTLPQYFKQHGYRTEAMGKLFHVGHGNTEDPRSWSVPHFHANVIDYALDENKAKLTREEAYFTNKSPANLPRGAAYEKADVPDSRYSDGKIADEAIGRLRAAKAKPDEPFFLAVGFVKPHLPFCAPKKYWDLYDPAQFKLAELRVPPVGAPSYAPQFGGELRNYNNIPGQGALPDDLQRTLIHGYYAAVSYMDAQLGRVLDELEKSEHAKNTIIMLWGDHGWHLGDHGMWCKHTNYEQAARIPLIMVAPGVTKPGSRSDAMIETVDLYPTICELAGLPARNGLDGLSMASAMKDQSAGPRDSIIHVYPRGKRLGRAIRTTRYRLVEWKEPGAATQTAEFELYDYESDPAETKTLAAENPQVVAQLQAILAKHPEAKPQWRPNADNQKSDAPPAKDRVAMFNRRDKNGDGKLSRDEFLTGQPDPDEAPKRFIAFDLNKDGVLSQSEFVSSGKKSD